MKYLLYTLLLLSTYASLGQTPSERTSASAPERRTGELLVQLAPNADLLPTIARLNKAFTDALRAPETKTRFEALMAEPVPTTPEQFDAFMAAERAKYQQVVKASGAKVD